MPDFLRSTPPLYLSQSRRTNSNLTLDAKPYEVGTLEGPLSESSLENMLMNNGIALLQGPGACLYSPSKRTWAVGSNRP